MNQKGGHGPPFCQDTRECQSNLVFCTFLFVAVIDFDGSSDGSQHLLGNVSVGSSGVALKVLLACLGRSRRSNLFVAVIDCDGSSDGSQHLLGNVSVGSSGLELKVLLECLGRSRRSNGFVALQSGLTDEVYALLIIGVGPVGVRCNALVKGVDGLIGLSSVGEHGTHVEVELSRPGGIGLGRLLVSFYCVISFACLAVSFGKIVVIGS